MNIISQQHFQLDAHIGLCKINFRVSPGAPSGRSHRPSVFFR